MNANALCPQPYRLQRPHGTSVLHTRLMASSGSSGCDPWPRGVPLPNGTWWLNDQARSRDVLYGDNFVIQREQIPQPEGLVVQRDDAVMIQQWVPSPEMGIVPMGPAMFRTALSLYRRGLPPEVIETKSFVLEDPEPGPATPTTGSKCLAIVRRDATPQQQEENLHPRRTWRVRFTCDRCRTVNVKAVNPHAWECGAVLCRCEGCNVVHLLRDQRGVFDTLKRTKRSNPVRQGRELPLELIGSLDPSVLQDPSWKSGGFELW